MPDFKTVKSTCNHCGKKQDVQVPANMCINMYKCQFCSKIARDDNLCK